MSHPRRSAAAILVLASGGAAAGGLQTADPVELAPVEVSASAEDTQRSSASEGTATAEQLANRPRLRPGELLEIVPGLIVTQHSGDGKANQYFLRGFNLDHGTDFRTTVAGMPVNMPTHGHGQGYTDLSFVIPELVSSIEYRKGAYYAEEGDFSAAGAAHLELMNQLPRPLATLELGEDGYRRLLGAGSGKLGEGRLLAALEASTQDGPWTVPEDTEKYNALLRYGFSNDAGSWSVTGMAYSNRWTATDQIPQRVVDSGQIGRYDSLDDSTGGDSHRTSLSLDWARGGEQSETRATAYFVDYDLDLFSNFTYFLDNPVDGDQFEQVDQRRYGGLGLVHERHGEWLGRHMHQRVGLDLRYDDIGEVGLHRTAQRQRLSTVREDGVEQLSAGAWYSNGIEWNPAFRSVLGLRADHYRVDVDSDNAANSGKDDDAIVSPKLSLIWSPLAKTSIFLNGGYGFHSNDARGATITVVPGSNPPEPADKVDLLVRAKSYELGLQTRPLPALQTALTLWQLDLDSELLFIGDAGNTEATRPSRRQGIEFSNYWTPRRGLIVDADIAWSRPRFDDGNPDDRIPGAIERTASLGVVLNDWRGWFGGARLRYLGSRPLLEDDSERSSSSTLVNLRGGYAFSPRLRLALDVFNVFDREVNDIEYYYTSKIPADDPLFPDGRDDRHFHPAEPRAVRLGLTAYW
ncbi:TonB-dependent receptor [Solimonas sp. K1W22B-7]|uniref:TonB-dependent receptor n=1 Tax=Solimonas sp. K1W22B-7 TaxID=2303331 RepID=UPI000E32E8F7|nr:TonB-dependent receptor [Solimonas sp. K1W22B-7]AXQ28308.1 TonB-dependent receptor [Solimonas sp. K1W22B-7]